jgi:hypothetical protein
MRLLDAVGIDAVQWKALTRTFVRADYGLMLGTLGRGQAGRAQISMVVAAIFYGLTGGAVGLMALSCADTFLGGAIVASYVVFLVGAGVLATHAGTIVSPDDHAILGFRPVTSRTYLAVRVATILVHTAVTAALVGYAPLAEFAIARGPTAAAALLVTVAMSAVAVTLAIVAGYAWLVNTAGPRRLARMVSYAQLASNSVIYFGLALASRSSLRHALDGVHLSRGPWVLMYPGAWFGSYLALASGDAGPTVVASALLSILCIGGLLWAIVGKLSLAYSDRLAAVATASAARHATAPARGWQWPFFGRGEARAISLLVRTQLKNDNRFRMGVLTFVPLTLFYLYTGTREGPIIDPFVTGSSPMGNAMLLQVVLYFLPASLKQLVSTSDAYRASWIFHVAPADRTRLVLAARNAITGLVVLPYLGLLAIVFAWSFRSAGHAALHVVFLGLMSQIVFQVVVLVDPRLPFADPPNRARGSGALFGGMTVLMIGGMVLYWLLTAFIYPSPPRIVLALGAFGVAVWELDRLTRRRIASAVEDLSYLA